MRLFVAVAVPSPRGAGLPENFERAPAHVTMRFLGETDPVRLPSIEEALRSATAGVSAFRVALSGIGAFPSTERPRVVWVGFEEGRAQLVELAARIEEALGAIGFPRERSAFVPHVTLLRVRGARDQAAAERLLNSPPAGPLGSSEVSEVLLRESLLGHGGAVHSTRSTFPLRTS